MPWLCLLAAGITLGRFVPAWLVQPSVARWAWAEPDDRYAAGLIARAHWFGESGEGAAPSAELDVKVLGVWASLTDAAAGFAVLDVGGKRVATRVGQSLPDGWSVAAVKGGGVLLRRAGVERFVPLAKAQAAAEAGTAPTPEPSSSRRETATD